MQSQKLRQHSLLDVGLTQDSMHQKEFDSDLFLWALFWFCCRSDKYAVLESSVLAGEQLANNDDGQTDHSTHGGPPNPLALPIITHSPRVLAYPYVSSFYTDIFYTISQSFIQFCRQHQYYLFHRPFECSTATKLWAPKNNTVMWQSTTATMVELTIETIKSLPQHHLTPRSYRVIS